MTAANLEYADRQRPDTLVLFDVDGTLTAARKVGAFSGPSGPFGCCSIVRPENPVCFLAVQLRRARAGEKSVKPDMLEVLEKLRKVAVVGFVGGSDLAKQKEQLGEDERAGVAPRALGGSAVDAAFGGGGGRRLFLVCANGLIAYRNGKELASQVPPPPPHALRRPCRAQVAPLRGGVEATLGFPFAVIFMTGLPFSLISAELYPPHRRGAVQGDRQLDTPVHRKPGHTYKAVRRGGGRPARAPARPASGPTADAARGASASGTFVEFRNGMINVSPIGRNCS
ncbi:MAG: hypothetical protein BJ554DRAFT_5993 [Olpidium bornovanus]|uniref:Phosphomannomutase n=1 Tax=Olpidium bornovanus TaxID=278681 RepID=A0A8H7ZYM4_9FUNG|nr:MAG: hypothetical protein BJ554DRAFT_5993 [Olpidium bornovanus]